MSKNENQGSESDDDSLTGKSRKNWLPLESDPDLMNKYIWRLGVSRSFEFVEILGVDKDLLSMVPQPVFAVLMLFPVSDASENHRRRQRDEIANSGQMYSDSVYWMKQFIGNACGTIGLIHAFFSKFILETVTLSPEERARALEANPDIEAEHESVAH